MTVHKLSAGDGYTYLTSQVAAADQKIKPGEALSDYYVVDGNPPGVWLGKGAAILGVEGQQVSEAQMRALFGEGMHPNADQIQKEALKAGKSPVEAIKAARLGRRFPQFKPVPDDGWNAAIKVAHAQFREDHHRDAEPGIERDFLRWNVAGQLLKPGASDLDRKIFLAGRGRSQRQAVAGFDLVFTPSKSVSTFWALSDEKVSAIVREVHEEAWRETVEWIQTEASLTRVGAGGVAQLDANGLTAVAFEHHDSRAGDPNLHTHVAISTKVQGEDGQWRSLDARVLYSLGVTGSERYNSEVETRLTDRLGVSFEDVTRGRGKQPVREIAGIDERVNRAFSDRRASIEAEYANLVAAYRSAHGREPSKATQFKMMQNANLSTRQAKGDVRRLSASRIAWRDQAVRVLGSVAEVESMVKTALGTVRVEHTRIVEVGDEMVDISELSVPELAELAVRRVSENRSTWTRWNVEAEAQRLGRLRTLLTPEEGTAQEIAGLIADTAMNRSTVHIEAPDLNPVPFVMRRWDNGSIYKIHGGTQLTSQAILAAEDNLVAGARTVGGPRVSQAGFAGALAAVEAESGRTLNTGQAALAQRFATGGRQIEVGIGPAGSGKTSSMKVFVRAMNDAGFRVIALGPSAVAAAVLGDELGIESDTLHKLILANSQAASAEDVPERYRLDARTILLVDEAGMAGTLRLERLQELAKITGASIRLLGDPKQLSSVEAGGALRLIANRAGSANLTEVHRFIHADGSIDKDQAAASLLLRDGKHHSLDFYVARNLVRSGSKDAMIEEVYANWSDDQDHGLVSLMIAGSSEDVAALNMRARTKLVAEGIVTAEGIELHNETTAGIGDLIVTRSNDRRLKTGSGWVRNGDIWTVDEIHADGRISATNGERGLAITLPADYVRENVELAYASTVNRVQGMTVDSAHFLTEQGTTREQLGVATTRARGDNRIYAVTEHLLDLDVHHKPDPKRAARDLLEGVLDHEDAQLSATETIEEVYARAASLSTLVPQYEDAATRVLDPERALRMSDHVHAVLDKLNPELAEEIIADPAWYPLATRLAEHEDDGVDIQTLLAAKIAQRDFSDAESVAQVLHWRVGPADLSGNAAATGLPPWVMTPPRVDAPITVTEASLPASDQVEVRHWLANQADLIIERIDNLVEQAAAGNVEWTDAIEPAMDESGVMAWKAQARVIVAYRDQYEITGPDPLGELNRDAGNQARHRSIAEKALENMSRIPEASDRGRRVTELVNQTIESQPTWLRPPPSDPEERREWETSLRVVVSYRAKYKITGASLLGDKPNGEGERAAYARAVAAAHGVYQRGPARSSPTSEYRGVDVLSQRIETLHKETLKSPTPAPSVDESIRANENLSVDQPSGPHM